MTELLRKNLNYLTMLKEGNVRQRQALLTHASVDQFKSLIELIYNILRGNIPISETDKKHLRRYRSVIYSLTSKAVNKKRKSQLIKSHHFLLPLYIEALLTYLQNDQCLDPIRDEQGNDINNEGDLSETVEESDNE